MARFRLESLFYPRKLYMRRLRRPLLLLAVLVLFAWIGPGQLLTVRPVFAQINDLIISEYVDGTSNNKALELYNGTGRAVNLGLYRLELYNNWQRRPTQRGRHPFRTPAEWRSLRHRQSVRQQQPARIRGLALKYCLVRRQ